ncbi:MAG: FtsX-like permease family protein [Candidatus Bathyarchaeia archaeon]
MRLKQTLEMALENLKRRRFRTSLTTLGVVIGITAIIALSSLGEGFRLAVKTNMEQGFELDVLTVIPGSIIGGYSYQKFTDQNVTSIRSIQNVTTVTPIMQITGASLKNGDKKSAALVVAAVNFTDFWRIFRNRLAFQEGGLPNSPKNDTIVIGHKVNTVNQTGTFAEVGDHVNVTFTVRSIPPITKTLTFNVTGILAESGSSILTSFDYWVFIPLTTGRDIYQTEESDVIFAQVNNPEISDKVADAIEALFPPFRITIIVPITFIRQVDHILNLIQIFLTSIAAISLLVAGIGIMNIMTVSVMERTREIGIMKAIGAKERTIMTMFLAETILIGLAGGLIGVPTGYGVAQILSMILSRFMLNQGGNNGVFSSPERQQSTAISPVFSLEWTIGALVFGILICVIFGWYPARKAAKLDPVQALRYE